MAHVQKSAQFLSRDELAKLVDRHPRRISDMAREGRIPGVTSTRRGRYERFFPVLRSPELDTWIRANRADMERQKREGRKRGPRFKLGPKDKRIDTATVHVTRIIKFFANLEHKGLLAEFTAEQLYALHRDLLPVLLRHAKVIALIKKAEDRPKQMLDKVRNDVRFAMSVEG